MGAHSVPGARLSWLTPEVRRYVYGIVGAAVAVLVGYQALSTEHAALWIALAGSILLPGLALAHTDTGTASGAPRTEETTREVNARQLP